MIDHKPAFTESEIERVVLAWRRGLNTCDIAVKVFGRRDVEAEVSQIVADYMDVKFEGRTDEIQGRAQRL